MESWIGWMGEGYLWVKTIHIAAVMFWMGSLLTLPRLLAYHQESVPGSPEALAWVEREKGFIKFVLDPMMYLSWLLGLALAANVGAWDQNWFVIKIVILLLMSWFHGWLNGYSRRLAKGVVGRTAKQMRMISEMPIPFVIVIIALAVVKPFG
jgi:protoporphyrinogen IX oxidase